MKDWLDEINEGPITESALILGEGKSDASFFFHLLEQRRIAGFQVAFPSEFTAKGHGVKAYGSFLDGLPLRNGFRDKLKLVIVTADNDGSPEKSMASIETVIRANKYHDLNAGFVSTADKKRVAIVMLPSAGDNGNLESLLLAGSIVADEKTVCLEAFVDCAGVDHWANHGNIAKMKLRSLIASSCHNDPECSLTFVWGKAGNPISLTHAAFTPLVDALVALRGAVA